MSKARWQVNPERKKYEEKFNIWNWLRYKRIPLYSEREEFVQALFSDGCSERGTWVVVVIVILLLVY